MTKCNCPNPRITERRDCKNKCTQIRDCIDSSVFEGKIEGICPIEVEYNPEKMMTYVGLDAGTIEGTTLITAKNPDYNASRPITLDNQPLRFVKTDSNNFVLANLFDSFLKNIPGYGKNATLQTDTYGHYLWTGGVPIAQIQIRTLDFPEIPIVFTPPRTTIAGQVQFYGDYSGLYNFKFNFDSGKVFIFEGVSYRELASGELIFDEAQSIDDKKKFNVKFEFTNVGQKTIKVIAVNQYKQELNTKDIVIKIVNQVDKTALAQKINDANDVLDSDTIHTDDEKSDFIIAIQTATDIYNDPYTNQSEIDLTVSNLEQAIEEFQDSIGTKLLVDKIELAQITLDQNTPGHAPTDQVYVDLENEITTAQGIADAPATQTQVDTEIDTLQTKIDDFLT